MSEQACWLSITLTAAALSAALAFGAVGCRRGERGAASSPVPTPAECITPDRAVVVVLTGPEGYLAPCGCTSNPLGGIAHLVEYWNEQKRCNKDPLLVTAGNFLFDTANLPQPSVEQEETKARLIAELYREMGVFAQMPGPADRAYKQGAFMSALDNPWLAAGEVRRSESAGVRLAFIGVDQTKPAAAELSELALRAKSDQTAPADAVIVLSARPWDQNRALALRTKAVDVIVSAGGPEPRTPTAVGEAMLLEAGEQGQYVGLLEFVRGTGERWAFDDGGAALMGALKRQLVVAERDVSALDDKATDANAIAVRQARVSRRDTLRKELGELEAHPPPPPITRYIRFTTVALTKKMPEAAAVKSRVAGYNALLCEFSKRATETLQCPPLVAPTPAYTGTERCALCHVNAFAQWRTTKHARAVETLEEGGKFCDLGCIGCHTTGFNQAGGFCSPQKVGVYKQVGCEMCHGRGAMHAEKGPAPGDLVVRSPDESVCRACHTREHSDQFDFKKYRERIVGPGHGKPAM